MTLRERLRQLASALPSDDCAVTITQADLVTLLEDDTREAGVGSTRDLNRDWRVPRAAPREYLEAQATQASETPGEVDITAELR